MRRDSESGFGALIAPQQDSPLEAKVGLEAAGLAKTLTLVFEEASMMSCGCFLIEFIEATCVPAPGFFSQLRVAACSCLLGSRHIQILGDRAKSLPLTIF
jgi:hypothetical protein